ncbi:hypothetical protein AYJ57_20685 (plasmid) [Salipiger sp. CCB-MM3]|nr:hypothetical protein AYJ57_20685 [Salipiger sp. CCB-MM3]
MGGLAQADGMAPHAGRILGYLMMSLEPVPFSDLSDILGISRGSVSENTRRLIEHGVIEKVRKDGDRRDHFQIQSSNEEAIFERSRQRVERNLETLQAFRDSTPIDATQKRRLGGMLAYMQARMDFEKSMAERTTHNKKTSSS